MTTTIPQRFLDRAVAQPNRVAMRLVKNDVAATTITWESWRQSSLSFAAALLSSEARNTGAVAILGGNALLWPVADLGTLICGKTSVGIYPTSAPIQMEKMLADCEAGAIVVDSVAHLESILEMKQRLPALQVVITSFESQGGVVVGWDDWIDRGAAALAAGGALERSIESIARSIELSHPAIIIYTSGSTGEPKGAVLSHGCIEASAWSIEQALGLRESDTTLSFLPFSHAAERITGLYTRIRCGMEAALVEDPSRLWAVAESYKPTMFGGLPRYYEKLHQMVRAQGRPASEILGGRVRLATSGGAPLNVEIARALHASGITVLGAYGLTEHLCVAFNRPDDPTFDTSGPAMPGTEIRIADDGEVLVRRCELTFSGYNNLPEETLAAFTDDGNWLRTGDLGTLDSHGRLRITGRKKELLVLSNGKMVAPLPIEARLATHPLIGQAVLYADGRNFVSALIALRSDSLAAWARRKGIAGSLDELAVHPLVSAEIQRAVDEVNATLSRAESIRRFVAIGHELSESASELTPTQKVRRNVVLEKYSAQLEALYN